jgi:hypothetical protein
MTFVVVYDANVLYPSTLRDVLIRLAQTGWSGRSGPRRSLMRRSGPFTPIGRTWTRRAYNEHEN